MVVRSFWSEFSMDYEDYTGVVSDTIPDMSMSVREILQRYSVGAMDIPSIETGEDETFDTPVDEFEDLSDASQAFSVGQSIVEQYNSSTQSEKVENSASEQSSSSSVDTSPE